MGGIGGGKRKRCDGQEKREIAAGMMLDRIAKRECIKPRRRCGMHLNNCFSFSLPFFEPHSLWIGHQSCELARGLRNIYVEVYVILACVPATYMRNVGKLAKASLSEIRAGKSGEIIYDIIRAAHSHDSRARDRRIAARDVRTRFAPRCGIITMDSLLLLRFFLMLFFLRVDPNGRREETFPLSAELVTLDGVIFYDDSEKY